MKKRFFLLVLALVLVIGAAVFFATRPQEITSGITANAAVAKLDGGKCSLTVTVDDEYETYTATFTVDSDAEGTYTVGDNASGQSEFSVYVSIKGNTKVRECYIVSSSQRVRLADGSLGTAADGAITGLALGYYYTVEVGKTDPVTMYVSKDGNLTAEASQLALLASPQISGITSGQTYNVACTADYPLSGGAFTQAMLDQIDAICQKYLNSNHTSLAVSVVKDGQIHYFNYGTAQSGRDSGFAEEADRTPVDHDSVYEIASLSKPFAAVLLAHFDRQGWLSMKDPIKQYFPQLPDYIDADGNSVSPTLEDLSSHTTGFPRMPRNWEPNGIDPDPQAPYEHYTRSRMEQELANMVYDYKPGTVNSYSNFAVGVLGNVLTDVYLEMTGDPRYDGAALGHYGQAYSNLLEDLLTGPLGLGSTKAISDDSMTARKTLPHNTSGYPSYEWHFDALAACGAVKSTTRDLALWMAFHTGDYNPSDELYAAAAESMIPRTNLDNTGRAFNALGWMLQPNRPTRTATLSPTGIKYGSLLYHNGAVGGYSTEYMCVPEANAGVVCLFNNSDQFNIVDPLCAEIIDVVLSGNSDSSDSSVKLTGDSEGKPGDRKIVELEPGHYYTLEIATATPYETITTYLFAKADGTVTDDPAQAGILTGSVITNADHGSGIRLLNGQTYKVTKSSTAPASVKSFRDEVYNLAYKAVGLNKLPGGISLAYFGDHIDGIGTLSLGSSETDRDGAETKTPITDQTLFELGGAGNTFTATLYQLLKQRGVIDETQTIGDYFPTAAKNEGVWPSLRGLATSRSGLPGMPASLTAIGAENYTIDNLKTDLNNLTYAASPGGGGYSDFAMGLLCIIMTQAYNDYYEVGLTYNEILIKELFEPLGMTATSLRGKGLDNSVALPHTRNGDPAKYLDYGILGQAVEIYTTSKDMGIWYKAFVEALRDPQEPGTVLGAMKSSQSDAGNTIFRLNNNGTYYYISYWSSGFNMTIIIHIPSWNACTVLGNFYDNSYILDNLANNISTTALAGRNANWV